MRSECGEGQAQAEWGLQRLGEGAGADGQSVSSLSAECPHSQARARSGGGCPARSSLSGSGSLGAQLWIYFSGGGSLVGWGSKSMHSGPRNKPCGICGIGGKPGMQQSFPGVGDHRVLGDIMAEGHRSCLLQAGCWARFLCG